MTIKMVKKKKVEKELNILFVVVPAVIGLLIIASFSLFILGKSSVTGMVVGDLRNTPSPEELAFLDNEVGEEEETGGSYSGDDEYDPSINPDLPDLTNGETETPTNNPNQPINPYVTPSGEIVASDGNAYAPSEVNDMTPEERIALGLNPTATYGDDGQIVEVESLLDGVGLMDIEDLEEELETPPPQYQYSAGSIFSNPAQDLSGIFGLFNHIDGVDMNAPLDWGPANWFAENVQNSWWFQFFGTSSGKAGAFCRMWFAQDNAYIDSLVGTGGLSGSGFGIQAEYVDISNPLDANAGIDRIYKVPWFITVPQFSNDDRRWEWEVYLATSDTGSGTSMYVFPDGSTHFIAYFGNGTVDYRGGSMFVKRSRNDYTHACIRFFSDGESEYPHSYIPTMPLGNHWCVPIAAGADYDYEAYCEDTAWFGALCREGSGGGSGGEGGQTDGNENNEI
jgi:hypothetical protein